MDEDGFIAFMKKKRKTPQTITACVQNAKEFERYMEEQGTILAIASTQNLESFIEDCLDKKEVSKFMWTLSYYFEFIDDKALLETANRIRFGKIKVTRAKRPFKLKEFRGLQPDHVAILANLGISDITKMLEVGKTPELRQELAERTRLEINVIEEFVKLSDLARIPGVKGIRARLYHESGFDIEKLRKVTPDELLRVTKDFVDKTSFDGIAPLPKEAQHTIDSAKKLPDVVEW
jgi:hypothetical protein